jgi:hypothetical protein
VDEQGRARPWRGADQGSARASTREVGVAGGGHGEWQGRTALVSRVWKIAGNWIREGTTLVNWTRKKHDKEIRQWP